MTRIRSSWMRLTGNCLRRHNGARGHLNGLGYLWGRRLPALWHIPVMPSGRSSHMAPAFKVLQQGVEEFGLTGTGTINALVGMFKVLNDEVTGPLFANLQATGQIFTGLQQGGLLTAELFQTVGTDIGDIFREMEAKGVDMSVALALSQPILQKLFEAQKNFGLITDETTQKMLDQAQQQGLVGDHMKDVNQKILDVLLIIADVFGAKIPDALRGLPPAARDAAKGVNDALGGIKAPKITVPVEFSVPDMPDFDAGGAGQ